MELVATRPVKVECTNCGDATAVVGIGFAAAALVISAASLYLSSLRRPNLDVEHVQQRHEFVAPADQGGMPGPVQVQVNFVVTNTGASATVLEALELYDFEQHGASIWAGPKSDFPQHGLKTPNAKGFPFPDQEVAFPVVFESGDSRSFRLGARLEVAVATREEFAAELAKLKRVGVVVVWIYRRPKLLRPWVRRRERHRHKLSFDVREYRNFEMDRWRANGHDELVNIAEGGNKVATQGDGTGRTEP